LVAQGILLYATLFVKGIFRGRIANLPELKNNL
jgi:hypothetical protein